jgi:hypothetical protein
MQYRESAAALLEDIIVRLRELDRLTETEVSHRLDLLEPLTTRLEAIRQDLVRENGLLPAMRKTNELRARLIGGIWGLDDPKYRSTLAALLGSYQRASKPPKAQLGGLRGGRPRKDGRPVRTMESKGYSAECLPAPKGKGLRIHPEVRKSLRAAGDQAES